MPYRKRITFIKKKPVFNKFQKKAYRRRQKRWKNRQQLLSVKTVKAIAKKVCTDVPEIKYKQYSNHFMSEISLGNPLREGASNGCRPYKTMLLGAHTFSHGNTQGQNIGNQILLRGIRLKLQIFGPLNFVKEEEHDPSVSQGFNTCPVHIHVVWSKDEPIIAGNYINNSLWDDKIVLNRMKKNNYKTIYKKVIYQPCQRTISTNKAITIARWNNSDGVDSNVSLTNTTDYYQVSGKRPYRFINKFIPIMKKINIQQTESTGMPKSLWLIAYVTPDKLGIGTNDQYNGRNDNGFTYGNRYSTRLNYTYTIHYNDS